jgi:hypothetical protein
MNGADSKAQLRELKPKTEEREREDSTPPDAQEKVRIEPNGCGKSYNRKDCYGEDVSLDDPRSAALNAHNGGGAPKKT